VVLSPSPSARKRFEGKLPQFKKEPSGGIGSFTADNFPRYSTVSFCGNVYVIADSNHGYKMIGVGHLVAEDISAAGPAISWSRSASRASPRQAASNLQQSVPVELVSCPEQPTRRLLRERRLSMTFLAITLPLGNLMSDLEAHVNAKGRGDLVKQVREKINRLGIQYHLLSSSFR